MIRRREFITLLGGAAAAWPLAAHAQQSGRMRRIGVLVALSADDALAQARNAAFLQGLADLGWRVGRNVQIDFRWGAGDTARYPKHAAELVELAPDVILAVGASVVWPALHATRTVPVVFVQVTDPVGAGYVASLARLGGNATGFTLFEFGISAKWIASKTAKTRIAMLHPGVGRPAVRAMEPGAIVTQYDGAAVAQGGTTTQSANIDRASNGIHRDCCS